MTCYVIGTHPPHGFSNWFRGLEESVSMECVQCVIWFFVISVCIAESVLSLPKISYLNFDSTLEAVCVWLHPVCVILLAVMHVPVIKRHAAAAVCAVVGITLYVTGNWFAASLIVLCGGIAHCTRGRETLECDVDADLDEEAALTAAHPAKIVKAPAGRTSREPAAPYAPMRYARAGYR